MIVQWNRNGGGAIYAGTSILVHIPAQTRSELSRTLRLLGWRMVDVRSTDWGYQARLRRVGK